MPSTEYQSLLIGASSKLLVNSIVKEAVLEQPLLTTTITNYNQKAELACTKKLQVQAQRKRIGLSLILPKQSYTTYKTAVYNLISPSNKKIFFQILKQCLGRSEDFYIFLILLYTTTTAIIKKACALSSKLALNYAVYFLQSQQFQRTLFLNSSYFSNSSKDNTLITL